MGYGDHIDWPMQDFVTGEALLDVLQMSPDDASRFLNRGNINCLWLSAQLSRPLCYVHKDDLARYQREGPNKLMSFREALALIIADPSKCVRLNHFSDYGHLRYNPDFTKGLYEVRQDGTPIYHDIDSDEDDEWSEDNDSYAFGRTLSKIAYCEYITPTTFEMQYYAPGMHGEEDAYFNEAEWFEYLPHY